MRVGGLGENHSNSEHFDQLAGVHAGVRIPDESPRGRFGKGGSRYGISPTALLGLPTPLV